MKKYEIDITVGGIQVKGTITVPDETAQPSLFQENGVKTPTEKQKAFLIDLGLWNESMTFDDAHATIGEYYANKNKQKEEVNKPMPKRKTIKVKTHPPIFGSIPKEYLGGNPEPLPFETDEYVTKRGRGRPRKSI